MKTILLLTLALAGVSSAQQNTVTVPSQGANGKIKQRSFLLTPFMQGVLGSVDAAAVRNAIGAQVAHDDYAIRSEPNIWAGESNTFELSSGTPGYRYFSVSVDEDARLLVSEDAFELSAEDGPAIDVLARTLEGDWSDPANRAALGLGDPAMQYAGLGAGLALAPADKHGLFVETDELGGIPVIGLSGSGSPAGKFLQQEYYNSPALSVYRRPVPLGWVDDGQSSAALDVTDATGTSGRPLARFKNTATGAELTIDANGKLPSTALVGPKRYVALLTQAGTNAPVATVLENTIGALVWTRHTTGTFYATLTGAFPAAKVWFPAPTGLPSAAYDAGRLTSNIAYLITLSDSGAGEVDGALTNTPIEIRVYP